MDGFQRLGEVYGSLQALMVFQDEIEINPNQCLFLFHILDRAFDVVSTEIQHNLRLRDHRCKTNLKWTALEHPLVELVGIFRGAEMYIAQCIQSGADFYAKAISLTYDNDVLEYHVYKLLSCLPVVMEALDYSFTETEIMCTRKKILAADNYDKEWLDPKLFQIRFGKRYLVSADMVGKLEMICREDRWNLMETIDTNKNKKKKKKKNPNQNKDQKLAEMLTGARGRFLPTSSLVGSKDYKIKRRLGGNGSHLKEIEWRGVSFVVRHILGDVKALVPEIKLLLPLSHPNIINIFCAFSDESKKECFLLMELMDKDLCSYIKEKTSSRSRHIFSLPVAVDLMVQIGRGMEYLHSNQIPHGNLNPSKILVKPTCNNAEDLHVKITGFGVKNFNSNSEKEDVYSFGKICSMLITGKYPSEGDSVSFLPPSPPKYLTHFIRWCLNSDPSHRPNFSSICRILRYVKRFLLLNPNHSRPYAPVPVVDYHELESSLCQRFSSWSETSTINVTEVPFQMFSYKVMEMEMIGTSNTINWSDSGSEENYSGSVTPAFQSPSRSPSPRPTSLSPGKSVGRRAIIGNQNPKKLTSTSASPCVRRFDTRTNSDGKLPPLSRHSLSPQQRKRMTHHVSDSEFV